MLIRCEQAEGRPIPKKCYDENGDLDQEHIFCAVCDRDESRDVSYTHTLWQAVHLLLGGGATPCLPAGEAEHCRAQKA